MAGPLTSRTTTRASNLILRIIAVYAIAAPASAFTLTTSAQVIMILETGHGAPEQLNSPQGLVVVSHLVGNGGVMLIENRSWQRLTFSQAGVHITCRPNRSQDPAYFASSTLDPLTLESGEQAEARVECSDNY